MKPRVIVITGVSRGLGRGWCEEFIRLGHIVCGCARNAAQIDALAETYPGRGIFRALDVLDRQQVVAWRDEIVQEYGCPDIVINNAATIHAMDFFEDIPADDFDQVLDVNVKGLANCVRAFLPLLKQAGRGVMVNMSSGWGRFGDAKASGYCASKFAVEGLTESLAKEVREGVAVLTLTPGGVSTGMSVDYWGEEQGESVDSWSRRAAPFVLSLGAAHNGAKLGVPGQ
jgi:NAD(P)-dependent dehydrogenase (short-subunit alcohol dehydrogenase family)